MYRATQVYLCASKKRAVKVHQQQSLLGMCTTINIITWVATDSQKATQVTQSIAIEMKIQ